MATNYGTATLGIADVPLISTQTSDPVLVVGQRVARRLITPRGGLVAIGGDPLFGWDVRQYTNGKMSPAAQQQAVQQIKAECEKDEAVQSASVTIVYSFNGALTISIALTSAVGPLTLVLPVANLTAAQVYTQ